MAQLVASMSGVVLGGVVMVKNRKSDASCSICRLIKVSTCPQNHYTNSLLFIVKKKAKIRN